MKHPKKSPVPASAATDTVVGTGGELHQVAGGTHPQMTNQRGTVIADDENSLKANARGPVLLEDFMLVEKTQHFDHERIPERIVHARGYGARGYFELTDSLKGITKAKVLTEAGVKTRCSFASRPLQATWGPPISPATSAALL